MKHKAFITVALFNILMLAGTAFAFGEDILAATGQYTFFIKPCPQTNTTYYQKMVPCVLRDTIQVPKTVVDSYPLPIPSVRGIPIVRHEQPVGCALGSSPCIECAPKPSSSPDVLTSVVPRMVNVRIPSVVPAPKEITKRVKLPQWFAVTEEPKPIRKAGK